MRSRRGSRSCSRSVPVPHPPRRGSERWRKKWYQQKPSGGTMLDTIEAVSLLTIMEIVGPILLGAALVYGILMSRRRSRASKIQTDVATRNLYREAAQDERKQ